MTKINLNKLAKDVALREGLRKQVNIAQIKEIIRITLDEFAWYEISEIIELLERYR